MNNLPRDYHTPRNTDTESAGDILQYLLYCSTVQQKLQK